MNSADGTSSATRTPLVTILGATGLVGSTVLALLSEREVRIRAVARRPAPVPKRARADIETRQADVTDHAQLEAAVAGSDAVLYLVGHIAGDAEGWRHGEGTGARYRSNVGSVRALVASLGDGAAGRPVVIFAGSTSQVGLPPHVRIDGTERDAPETEYDRQKLAAERAVREATERGVLRGTTLRLPTVYGVGAEPEALGGGIVLTMVRRALAGQPLTMWHDGSVARDLVHVRDVARAFVAALDHADALAGRHWLIGGGDSRPLGRIFEMLAGAVAEHTGRPAVPVRSVPPPDYANVTDFHGVDVDDSAFRRVTGWAPEVPLADGLRRTVAELAG